MRTMWGKNAGVDRRGAAPMRQTRGIGRPVRNALLATAAIALPLTAVLANSSSSAAAGSLTLPASVGSGLLSTVTNTISSLSNELKNGLVLPTNSGLDPAGVSNGTLGSTTNNVNAVPAVSNSAALPGPNAPTSVKAGQSSASPDLTVKWTNANKGSPTQADLIQLWLLSTSPATLITTLKCGSCNTITFRELTAGATYHATVIPIGVNGSGSTTTSNPVTMQIWCLVGACVSFDATTAIGPSNHAASGILESLLPVDNDAADLAALDATSYRGGLGAENPDGSFNFTGFDTASAEGAKNIVELDSVWKAEFGDGGTNNSPPTPWSNWTAYSNFIKKTVSAILATGHKADYFEIYNEPGGNDLYYDTAGYNSETPALLLQQFDVAYKAIKAADPAAQVIGPDLSQYEDYAGEYAPFEHAFDMPTFLNYAAANNIKLAAISWHEILNNYGISPRQNTLLPSNLQDDVALVRSIVAGLPALGNPKIFIDEYGIPDVQKIPGWDVEYMAALTNAGVDLADRSCWGDDCLDPTLDGLLYSNGTSPLPGYYDRLIYSAMSGNMISTGSSSDTVAALGSYNSSPKTLTGLVGRGVGCAQNTEWCTSAFTDYAQAAPTPVLVTINVPWTSGSATVALTDIAGGSPDLPVGGTNLASLQGLIPELPAPTPAPVDTTYPIVPAGPGRGSISVLIPSFADGDAYGFSVTH
jgi:hypothetical protein